MSDDLIKRSDALSAAGDMSYIAFEIRRKIRMIPSVDAPYKVLAHIDIDPDEVVDRMKHLQIEVNPADRPQGEWIRDDIGTLICSECKRPRRDNRIDHTNFCNSCGAKMI